MVHEEEERYYKDDEVKIESQDHGKKEKANMSTSRANRVAVIEHHIGLYLPGSRHYDNRIIPTYVKDCGGMYSADTSFLKTQK